MFSNHNIKKRNLSSKRPTSGQKAPILDFSLVAAVSDQTDDFKTAVLFVSPTANIPALRDILYRNLFRISAVEIRQRLGITPAMSIRDHLAPLAYQGMALVEEIICQRLMDGTVLDEAEAARIVTFVAGQHAINLHVMAGYLRVDLITGEPWPPED